MVSGHCFDEANCLNLAWSWYLSIFWQMTICFITEIYNIIHFPDTSMIQPAHSLTAMFIINWHICAGAFSAEPLDCVISRFSYPGSVQTSAMHQTPSHPFLASCKDCVRISSCSRQLCEVPHLAAAQWYVWVMYIYPCTLYQTALSLYFVSDCTFAFTLLHIRLQFHLRFASYQTAVSLSLDSFLYYSYPSCPFLFSTSCFIRTLFT